MPMCIKNLYTCPKCGHSVGWRRRWLYSGGSKLWPCKNCGTSLRIGSVRRLILLPTVIVSTALWVKPHVNFWVFMIIFIFGMFLALSADPIQKNTSEA